MSSGRTVRRRECRCGKWFDVPEPWPHPWPRAYCTPECHQRSKRKPAEKPRKPVSTASRAQREKRTLGASIVSGETRGLDAAHLCSRALAGCDDPDCVVPLTREEHRRFDRPGPNEKQLDLLPFLIAHGCLDELAHALRHYNGNIIALLERLTGCRVVLVDHATRREAA